MSVFFTSFKNLRKNNLGMVPVQIFRSFKFASDRIRTLEACGKKPRDYVGLLTPFLAARDRNVRSLALKALRLPLDETAARRILHHVRLNFA